MKEQDEWIRAADKLPEKSGRYLVFHDGGYDIALFSVSFGFIKSRDTDVRTWFWMPLPEKPQERSVWQLLGCIGRRYGDG